MGPVRIPSMRTVDELLRALDSERCTFAASEVMTRAKEVIKEQRAEIERMQTLQKMASDTMRRAHSTMQEQYAEIMELHSKLLRAGSLLAILIITVLLATTTTANAYLIECQISHPGTERPADWAYRIIDGRKCWYKGPQMMPKKRLKWGPVTVTVSAPDEAEEPQIEAKAPEITILKVVPETSGEALIEEAPEETEESFRSRWEAIRRPEWYFRSRWEAIQRRR